MANFKDWKEGEYRLKAELVTTTGAKLEYNIPHLSREAGAAAIAFLDCYMVRNPVIVEFEDQSGERLRLGTIDEDDYKPGPWPEDQTDG